MLVPFNNKNHSEFNISTTQAMSKPLDGLGVDVFFNYDLPKYIRSFNIQCKKTLNKGKSVWSIDVKPLLDIKVKGINLLFTRVTKKLPTKKGVMSKKETIVTEIVTMELETFKIFLNAYQTVHRGELPDGGFPQVCSQRLSSLEEE